MTNLEFINEEIEITKKQLNNYPLTEKQSDLNYKYEESYIKCMFNKFYNERLQTLQQIKNDLETLEIIINKNVDILEIIACPNLSVYNKGCVYINHQLTKKEYDKIIKSVNGKESEVI